MATEVQDSRELGVTSLVKGIVNDVGALVKQEISFAQAEIKTDLRKTGEASGLLAAGTWVASIGGLLLAFMLVHLLNWLTLPPGTEKAGLPLWACYAIFGSLILATGAALMVKGKKKFDSFNPLPVQTAQTLKENVEWITNSK